ncbi:hypothetical protein M409DRAFT_64975 [Zasmidium cellare ATCC 36951]|uniref:Rhodopsin domain-containing protein n=1 Tax=Zasmidium cellare ATCC 36951 TaxID=1080233 RepID=A0A6A6CRB7_ZASCE|nr:uncharacterized protein M409DRAFT_64975 [Zasmidium cellare ATCC 36951]KAF2169243.1 hypothetical protein M409DRAFT_64975 [Zasmidium cellare ATCC 36951]
MAMTLPNADLSEFMQKQVFNTTPYHFNTYAMNEDRLALIVVGVIFTVIGTLAIVARISNLALRRRKAWYDDYSMLVAYVFSIAFMIASYVSVRWGVGLELKDAPPYWATRAIQAVYAIEVFYYFSLFFVKLSIVFLYLRLAKELRNYFYYWSLVLIGVLTLHFITTVIVFSTQCIPMEKYWAPSTPGKCISITAFFYSTNVFTIVTDIIMLALPVPTVWKVPYSLPHKIGIIAAFLCGGFSTIASCVRLYSIRVYTESPQPLRDAAPINTWSFIEINIAICCASVAVIRQFVASASRQNSLSSTNQPSTTSTRALWFNSSTPSPVTSNKPDPDQIARWPSPAKSRETDLEAMPLDIDGTPIRQSMPLPPSPAHTNKQELHSSGGGTALPQKGPMLKAFVTWEGDGDGLRGIERAVVR